MEKLKKSYQLFYENKEKNLKHLNRTILYLFKCKKIITLNCFFYLLKD